MKTATVQVVALATQGAERRFKLCPTAQIKRIKKWAKKHGHTVSRAFYFTEVLHPATKRCALSMAIDEARKCGAVIVVLDSKGEPTALKVLGGE